MKYTPVIGLEIHVELNTKTKMFCSCSADYFGKKPNTHTCPVCLGLPGALPYINKKALDGCMQIGLALNCKVNKTSRFERKNYSYPDLAKGYQISQYRWPLCTDGELVIGNSDSAKKIRINRVHIEEDTAKLVHQFGNPKSEIRNSKHDTGVDYNRSGVPLVEIVTEPDFDNAQDVVDFAKQLQTIIRDLDVSNADMEKGDMRLEANVSVRDAEQVKSGELPNYRIELKNINSFRFMQHAIEYEIVRQSEALENGEILNQETRGWNEAKGESYLQRAKEEAHDYRYFPDPDLPELVISDSDIDKIQKEMPELSTLTASRLASKFNIPVSSVLTLINQGQVKYFEEVFFLDKNIDTTKLVNLIINKKVDTTNTTPGKLVETLRAESGRQSMPVSDLAKIVGEVINDNPKVIQDYKSGKTNALQFLLGQVMKSTRGQATPESVKNMLEEKLND